jgi:hypothetical protein
MNENRKPSNSPKTNCTVCDGHGSVPAGYVFSRSLHCTCGVTDHFVKTAARLPSKTEAEMMMHTADCDTLPCPFCHLTDIDVSA